MYVVRMTTMTKEILFHIFLCLRPVLILYMYVRNTYLYSHTFGIFFFGKVSFSILIFLCSSLDK